MKSPFFYSLILLGTAFSQEKPIVVVGSNANDAIDSLEKAQEAIQSVPGGASVISIEESAIGNAYNTKEILAFTPGVFAREGSVQLDARLSIRGGGATRRFGSRGTTLLIDGVPTNQADGSFFTRGYDGSNIDYVEVYRGANGLAKGSYALGGALNFAQKNGKTDPGLTAFAEFGSFDLFRAGASYGHSEGKVDAFINVSRGESDGFRDFQGYEQNFINANVGYQWNDRVATRVYVSHIESDVDLGSALTLSQLEENPRQTNNNNGENRDLIQTRIAQKTTFTNHNTDALFYTFFQITDFDHLISSTNQQLVDTDSNDFGLGLNTVTEFDHFTLRTDSSLVYGEQDNDGVTPNFRTFPITPEQENTLDTFFNLKLYGELEYQVTDRLSLFGGLGVIYATREREVLAGDETANVDFDADYASILPKVGIQYKLSDEASVFANYSRAFEPPAGSEASAAAELTQEALAAEADSFEIGARISNNRIRGEFGAFYTVVNNEFTNEGTSLNADAVYSGIELAGSAALWGGDFGETGLFLDLNYIYSNYFFTNGEDRGNDLEGNEFPGIPQHALNIRLKFQHEDGHEIALSAEASSGLQNNNLNAQQQTFFSRGRPTLFDTPESDEYIIFNLTGRYQLTENISIYGGVRNLFDEEYVNNVTINPPSASIFSPGDGVNYFLGAKVNF